MATETDLNLKATELRLGLPGTEDMVSAAKNNKRPSPHSVTDDESEDIPPSVSCHHQTAPPRPKAQIVGWPPVRKNNVHMVKKGEGDCGIFVKVSMDGAPYLRKIDLKVYNGYAELLKALETMFNLPKVEYSERDGYKGSEYAPAYEDKDGDLMLLGDVPWDMFKSSCKRLRIMLGGVI